MSAPQYIVVILDLAIPRSNTRIPEVPSGVNYDGVILLSMPGGAVISLGFGENRPLVPLDTSIRSFNFIDECGNPFQANEGLFVFNPIGAGLVTLLISVGTISTGA